MTRVRRSRNWVQPGGMSSRSSLPGDSGRPPYDPGQYVPEKEKARPLGKPRPGHGRVLILPGKDPDDFWWGSWQDDYPRQEIVEGGPIAGVEDKYGTREEVLEWARSRPAKKHLISSAEADGYVPLPPGPD